MIGPIKPFNSIGWQEHDNLEPLFGMLDRPLSGYLAGRDRGGHYVRALEDAWCEEFSDET